MSTNVSKITLNNQVAIPQIGLGVYKVISQKEVTDAIGWAYDAGYRHIDTAMFYGNESMIATALKELKIPREELFITSKLWNTDHGYQATHAAFQQTLERLDTEYLDMYLIHWPTDHYIESWQAMEELYHVQKIKAIGVSNFQIHHLQNLMAHSSIKLVVDQVETHPYFQQSELHHFLNENKIAHEAWGPLGQGKSDVLANSVLTELANKYHKTTAQIILRWHIDRQVIAIPKSIHQYRIQENIDIFDFQLSAEDMKKIATIDKNKRGGKSPDDLNWLTESSKN